MRRRFGFAIPACLRSSCIFRLSVLLACCTACRIPQHHLTNVDPTALACATHSTSTLTYEMLLGYPEHEDEIEGEETRQLDLATRPGLPRTPPALARRDLVDALMETGLFGSVIASPGPSSVHLEVLACERAQAIGGAVFAIIPGVAWSAYEVSAELRIEGGPRRFYLEHDHLAWFVWLPVAPILLVEDPETTGRETVKNIFRTIAREIASDPEVVRALRRTEASLP